MTDDAIRTLLPFETGDLPLPAGKWAFLGAVGDSLVGDIFAGADLVCEQPGRGAFLDLQDAGFATTPALADAPAGRFDGALVLLGKHRRLNQARIARAARMVRPGAPVVFSGPKSLGAAAIRKWLAARLAPLGALAKHHGLVVWFAAEANALADVALAQTTPAPGLVAAPGMFSAERIDAGSALLAGHIDGRIAGAVADFGAGWGYLGAEILARGRPETLDLVEAHKPSLDAALANLRPRAGTVPVAAHWLDLTRETPPRRYDVVVMNPPFHAGRRGDPDLGRAFIAAAAAALVANGRLLMVANRHLPYEDDIRARFARMWLCAQAQGFKVIEAMRPVR
ncbi:MULTISPECIES: class I SAM-dependent methyltransferase [unclassified Roseitalea]|uniref:class I SAM-dependent methyltransferase n=1 Tax=unclassified Roseitalea TaxID=2639107 RepID=UPI00273D5F40|nr:MULTISPECIES: class I SAM-dependent methyltransferase [unclassified Roseitalea]